MGMDKDQNLKLQLYGSNRETWRFCFGRPAVEIWLCVHNGIESEADGDVVVVVRWCSERDFHSDALYRTKLLLY